MKEDAEPVAVIADLRKVWFPDIGLSGMATNRISTSSKACIKLKSFSFTWATTHTFLGDSYTYFRYLAGRGEYVRIGGIGE